MKLPFSVLPTLLTCVRLQGTRQLLQTLAGLAWHNTEGGFRIEK